MSLPTTPTGRRGGVTARDARDAAHRIEWLALRAVERAAREYARHSHGNMGGPAYHRREEARDALLDALSQLDHARGVE